MSVWVQHGTGRLVEVIEVRIQGPDLPSYITYRFLDNGRVFGRVRPEFTSGFSRAPAAAARELTGVYGPGNPAPKEDR